MEQPGELLIIRVLAPILGIALAVVLFLSGCGSKSSSPAESTATTTTTESTTTQAASRCKPLPAGGVRLISSALTHKMKLVHPVAVRSRDFQSIYFVAARSVGSLRSG